MRSVTEDGVARIVRRSLPSNANSADFEYGRVTVHFARIDIQLHYNDDEMIATVHDKTDEIKRTELDPLRAAAREACSEHAGRSDFSIAVTMLQAIEIISGFEAPTAAQKEPPPEPRWSDELDDPLGLSQASTREILEHVLGCPVDEVLRDVPSRYHVRHVEPVLRQDLARTFFKYQAELRAKLEADDNLQLKIPPESALRPRPSLDEIRAEMLRPRLVFRAVQLHQVPGLVRAGMRVRLRRDGKRPYRRTFHIGCERSREEWPAATRHPLLALVHEVHEQLGEPPWTARSARHTLDSFRLVAMAAVIGRSHNGDLQDYWWHEAAPGEPFDGAVFGDWCEVRDPRALLPCYVVDVDLRGNEAELAGIGSGSGLDPLPAPPPPMHPALAKGAWQAPGDAKREREARKAAGLKHFSSGFGTARGTRFVVEAVGATDDDEEVYGRWQGDRYDMA